MENTDQRGTQLVSLPGANESGLDIVGRDGDKTAYPIQECLGFSLQYQLPSLPTSGHLHVSTHTRRHSKSIQLIGAGSKIPTYVWL